MTDTGGEYTHPETVSQPIEDKCVAEQDTQNDSGDEQAIDYNHNHSRRHNRPNYHNRPSSHNRYNDSKKLRKRASPNPQEANGTRTDSNGLPQDQHHRTRTGLGWKTLST